MPIPALIGAVGALATAMGSGILANNAQKSANRTNLAIANKTNKTNYKIAQESNALTHQMMLEQMKYASPLEQRRMLQEAGYNPALYGDSKAMPAGSPTATTGAPQIAPTVQPEDGLARSIGNMSGDLGSLIVAASQARKNNAEAQQVEIQNGVEEQRLKLVMENLGLGNEYQSIVNNYAGKNQQLNLDYIASQIGWNQQQIENAKIAYEIEKYKHDKLQPAEYNKIVQEVKKMAEEEETERSLQSYYATMEKVGMKQADAQALLAQVAKFKAPHEVALMDSERGYYGEMGARTHEEMVQLKKYGPRLKNAEFLNILQQTSTGKVNAYEGWQRAKKIIKDLKYSDFEHFAEHPWLYPMMFDPSEEIEGNKFNKHPEKLPGRFDNGQGGSW